jgi:hypothetical protein
MSIFINLAIVSGFALNGLLQLGLGIKMVPAKMKFSSLNFWLPPLAMLITAPLSWVIRRYIFSFLGFGFMEVFLLFPISALISLGIGNLLAHDEKGPPTKGLSAYDGLVFAVSFITIRWALRFSEALVIALSFSLSYVLVSILVTEIHKRSVYESVPSFLQGRPLVLISMALLSLVFAFISVALLSAAGHP